MKTNSESTQVNKQASAVTQICFSFFNARFYVMVDCK